MNELDKNGKPISDCAQETLNEIGGIPETYKARVSILRATTGDKPYSNLVIDIGLEGIYIGSILGMFSGNPETLVVFNVEPEWEAIKWDAKGNGKLWGRKLEMYDQSIIIKDINEMVQLYDQHKTEIERMKSNQKRYEQNSLTS